MLAFIGGLRCRYLRTATNPRIVPSFTRRLRMRPEVTPAAARRRLIGTLPAIPFEVVGGAGDTY
jgi:hypothetical protein